MRVLVRQYITPAAGVFQNSCGFACRYRTREQIALAIGAAENPKLMHLVDGFDAFSDHAQPKCFCQGDHRLNYLTVLRSILHGAYKGTVNLECIDRKSMQIAKA